MQCQNLEARPVKLSTELRMSHPQMAMAFPTSRHTLRLGRQISQQRKRNNTLQVVSWSFFKKLGLQKPAWLPDFGQPRRQRVLERFFGSIDRPTYEELLAPNFIMVEESDPHRTFSKQGITHNDINMHL